MATTQVNTSNTVFPPGVYVEDVDSLSPDMPAVTRELARTALDQICQRELTYFVLGLNVPKTWEQVVLCLRGHLVMLWCKDLLQGRTAQEAFCIRCDATTMTPDDLQSGTLICLVGMAPVKASELVTFCIRIQLKPRP